MKSEDAWIVLFWHYQDVFNQPNLLHHLPPRTNLHRNVGSISLSGEIISLRFLQPDWESLTHSVFELLTFTTIEDQHTANIQK